MESLLAHAKTLSVEEFSDSWYFSYSVSLSDDETTTW
jgi:hypothetical protein